MNNEELVKIEGEFESGTLRVLRRVPGVAVIERPPQTEGQRADAILWFAGTQARVEVEIKKRANAATAWQLAHHAENQPGVTILLIAEHTTAEARRILARHGIGLIDGLGNAHIELQGLLFHVEGGRKPEPEVPATSPPTRLRGKAGTVAQALLLNPERPWQVQDLAEEAGISQGLAHRVLKRLENEGLLSVEGAGPARFRRLVDPTALLDLWTEENADHPTVRRGFLLAQSPRQLIRRVGSSLGLAEVEYAVTGAAAASLLTPYVTALPVVEAWVTENADLDDLLGSIGAQPVSSGQNVLLMQAKGDVALAFRQSVEGVYVPNVFRLYLDLRRDPRRGAEQATHLREELIRF